MKTASLPCRGIYTRALFDPKTKKYSNHSASCRVLKESIKTYFIELDDAIGKRLPGDRITVSKGSVVVSAKDKDGHCHEYGLKPNLQSCRACIRPCIERFL